jgi:uncharacterized protein (DUF4415 family)
MITLKQWMEVVEYRVTEGSEYCWKCYGYDAYALDSWNGNNEGHSFTVIFDTKTQVVYEVQAHDYKNNRAYRMINPEFVEANRKEAEQKNVSRTEAWENTSYVDLDLEEDFLEKAKAIVNGEDYDTRVRIPLDFTDEELLTYMTMAHERDMTFNAFIEEALRHAIDKYKLTENNG